MNFKHHAQFFTATILNRKPLLQNDAYKDIIISNLKFTVEDKRADVYSFVVMPNHIHLIWQISDGYRREQVQQSFLKYTAQQIKFDLQKNNPTLLEQFRVDAKDREFQLWERNPLSIDLFTEEVFSRNLIIYITIRCRRNGSWFSLQRSISIHQPVVMKQGWMNLGL